MKIFICEDNKGQRFNLEQVIVSVLEKEDIKGNIELSSDSSKPIIDYISNNRCKGVYFLDIHIGEDMNGIELAEQINQIDKDAIIIMITSNKDMSHLVFKYHIGAIDYIVKENFEEVKKRVKECIICANNKLKDKSKDEYFFIERLDSVDKIKYEDILYFETCKKRFIGLNTVDSYIEFNGTLKDLEKKLDDRFIRCHKSYIVNKNKISNIDKKQRIITMEGGSKCYVSLLLLKKTVESILS
ncbi:LytTR family two component transcriptional regulator [[Clostridium] sordellii]|uniref:LytR/AlgR family response regulator transcription factor n=1 Tax=Paraclostridium sordellii TaxID=1505 RepID=UPI0005E422F2|nr:LytTR family DNA-binding domain-containing protein [Paeniclostridium sordellii]CEP98344.1 LytTR family two component transcriptional regulator [[Clostridium] sordellii] [Paeniclostridium sordellii]